VRCADEVVRRGDPRERRRARRESDGDDTSIELPDRVAERPVAHDDDAIGTTLEGHIHGLDWTFSGDESADDDGNSLVRLDPETPARFLARGRARGVDRTRRDAGSGKEIGRRHPHAIVEERLRHEPKPGAAPDEVLDDRAA
jgi:hypothetical protein